MSEIITQSSSFHQGGQIFQVGKLSVGNVVILIKRRQIVRIQAVGNLPVMVNDNNVLDAVLGSLIEKGLPRFIDQVLYSIVLGRDAGESKSHSRENSLLLG